MRDASMTLPAAWDGRSSRGGTYPRRSVLVEQELIRILSTQQLPIKMSAVLWKKTLEFLSVFRRVPDNQRKELLSLWFAQLSGCKFPANRACCISSDLYVEYLYM